MRICVRHRAAPKSRRDPQITCATTNQSNVTVIKECLSIQRMHSVIVEVSVTIPLWLFLLTRGSHGILRHCPNFQCSHCQARAQDHDWARRVRLDELELKLIVNCTRRMSLSNCVLRPGQVGKRSCRVRAILRSGRHQHLLAPSKSPLPSMQSSLC